MIALVGSPLYEFLGLDSLISKLSDKFRDELQQLAKETRTVTSNTFIKIPSTKEITDSIKKTLGDTADEATSYKWGQLKFFDSDDYYLDNNGDIVCERSSRDNPLPQLQAQYRNYIKPGTRVMIVLKKDQRSGKLTEGIVKNILTSKRVHTRGIKVRLTSGQVGRVQKIMDDKY